MRHCLLLWLILLVTVTATRAQQRLWCPPGATWTYDYRWFSGYGDLIIRYAGDTVVAGRSCQKLTKELVSKDFQFPQAPATVQRYATELTAADADRVYFYAHQQFHTLYDFSARPGDSWQLVAGTFRGWCTAPVRVVVDSVGRQQRHGQLRRWFRAHLEFAGTPAPAGQLHGFRGRIYEGLGPVADYMFVGGSYAGCGGTDPENGGALRCFSAAGQPTYVATAAALCRLVLSNASLAHPAALAVQAYPNPATDHLYLRLPALGSGTAALHTPAGRCLLRQAVAGSATLDIRGLPKGLYLLRLERPNLPTLTRRVMVQH